MDETSKQDKNQDMNRNPTGKGGFADNPQNINRDGRPKNEESPTYWLRKYLSEIDPKTQDGRIRLEQLAIKLAIEAMGGSSWAMQEVFDRLDGKAPQTVMHKGSFFTENKLEIIEVPIDDDKTEPEAEAGTETTG